MEGKQELFYFPISGLSGNDMGVMSALINGLDKEYNVIAGNVVDADGVPNSLYSRGFVYNGYHEDILSYPSFAEEEVGFTAEEVSNTAMIMRISIPVRWDSSRSKMVLHEQVEKLLQQLPIPPSDYKIQVKPTTHLSLDDGVTKVFSYREVELLLHWSKDVLDEGDLNGREC